MCVYSVTSKCQKHFCNAEETTAMTEPDYIIRAVNTWAVFQTAHYHTKWYVRTPSVCLGISLSVHYLVWNKAMNFL